MCTIGRPHPSASSICSCCFESTTSTTGPLRAPLVGKDNDIVRDNPDNHASSSMTTGAVSIGGVFVRPGDDDSAPHDIGSMMGNSITVEPTTEVEQQLVAQLAPDDYAEIEATIAQKVEERLRQQRVEGPSSSNIIVVAEEVNDSSQYFGFQRRTICISLVILLLLVIGGVIVGVVHSEDSDDSVSSPTPAPITIVDQPLVEELRSLNVVSDEELSLFRDPTSPQYQALTWLANDSIVMSRDRSTQDLVQRYILAVLYFATSGTNWTSSYFLSSNDVCTWNNGTEYGQGVYCPLDGDSVTELTLENNNLQGQLPWALVLLTNLEILHLSYNRLTGSIPTRISEITRLRTLDLSHNILTGTLPTTFSPKTNSIDLTENDFSGTIPQGWGASMPGLVIPLLFANDLTSPIPTTFNQLSKLDHMNLSWNRLNGTIPSELGKALALESLGIRNNLLEGTIPTELGKLFSLEYLTIVDNGLTGTVPSELGRIHSLTSLSIGANQLSGTIPSEMGQMFSLDFLDFGGNQLIGTVPSELGQLLVLKSFSIQENQLTSSLPFELAHLLSLRLFDFTDNLLTGSVNELLCTGNHSWQQLSADCDEVVCECCTKCCYIEKSECEYIFN